MMMMDIAALAIAGAVLVGAWLVALVVVYGSIGFGENRAD